MMLSARPIPSRWRHVLAATLASAFLTGLPPSPARAANDAPPGPRVAYDGDALVVDGTRYAPQVDAEECGSAAVLCRRSKMGVAWRKGLTLVMVANRDVAAVTEAISRFGLPLSTTPRLEPETALLAVVPPGFELHWSKVIARVDGVIGALPAPVMAIDQRWNPAPPFTPIVSDVQYDGETLVVRGVRYERQPGMQYCRDDPRQVCTRNGYSSRALGSIRVAYRPESKRALLVRLSEAGLTPIEEIEGASTLVVEVPGFFEYEWLRALIAELDVRPGLGPIGIPRTSGRTFPLTLSHEAGGVAVTPSQRERIATLIGEALAADQCGVTFVSVVGHADLRETSDPAHLSAARADYVRDAIVRHAGAAARVHVDSKAASQMVALAGAAENARTEVEFNVELYGKVCAAKWPPASRPPARRPGSAQDTPTGARTAYLIPTSCTYASPWFLKGALPCVSFTCRPFGPCLL